ncbi:hypothetical protein V8C42DRAFT_319476 [Trichoderma barbatum]
MHACMHAYIYIYIVKDGLARESFGGWLTHDRVTYRTKLVLFTHFPMAKTILDALASRNPSLENLAHEGPNTIGDGWIHVESWRPWREFN